jgi:hypothetical protein
VSDHIEQREYVFPNRISRIMLLAMREVMGENGINAILNTARLQYLIDHYPPPNFEPGLTFDEMGRLFEAIEGIYGIRGGRRLAWRSGEVCFKYGIEGFGGVIGFADFALRLLPMTLRVRIGLEVLAEIFNRYTDHHVRLGEGEHSFFFVMDRCGFCWGHEAETPACALIEGLLQESLYWVSRGKRFLIEGVSCIACGDPVGTLRVEKTPLE